MVYSVPEDMEKRRLADLKQWVLNHPNDPVNGEEPPPAVAEDWGPNSWYHWLQEKQPANKEKRQTVERKLGPHMQLVNKWDMMSTLELLTEMRKFQESLNELEIKGIRVTSCSRWTTIAQRLPNRCGLEPSRFSKSCQVHFANLCRVYKGQKRTLKGEGSIEGPIRRAMEDYFRLAPGHLNLLRPAPRKESEPHLHDGLVRGSEKEKPSDMNYGKKARPYDMLTEKMYRRGERKDEAKFSSYKTPNRIRPEETDNWGLRSEKTKRSAQWRPSSDRHRRHHHHHHHHGNCNDETWSEGIETDEDSSWDEWMEEETNYNDDFVHPEAATKLNRHEQELPGHRHSHQRAQEVDARIMNQTVSPTNRARWDTVSTLKLLAAIKKNFLESRKAAGARYVIKWERVSSQLANHCQMDPKRFTNSCRAHYSDVLRVYRRGKDAAPYKPLAAEVRSRLEEWLQLSSPGSLLNSPNMQRVDQKKIESERGVHPAFRSVFHAKNDEERLMMSKNGRLNPNTNGGDVEKTHRRMGLMKTGHHGQPKTCRGWDRALEVDNESSSDDYMRNLQLEDDSEMEGDESRRRSKKRSRDRMEKLKRLVRHSTAEKGKKAVHDGEELMRNGHGRPRKAADDRARKETCKICTSCLADRSRHHHIRRSDKAAALKCTGPRFGQARNMVGDNFRDARNKRSGVKDSYRNWDEDQHMRSGFKDSYRKGGEAQNMRSGLTDRYRKGDEDLCWPGAIMKGNFKDKEKKRKERVSQLGVSKAIFSGEEMRTKEKLKHDYQTAVKGKKVCRPFTHSAGLVDRSRQPGRRMDSESNCNGDSRRMDSESNCNGGSYSIDISDSNDEDVMAGDECSEGMKETWRDRNSEKQTKCSESEKIPLVPSGKMMASGKLQQSETALTGRGICKKLNSLTLVSLKVRET